MNATLSRFLSTIVFTALATLAWGQTSPESQVTPRPTATDPTVAEQASAPADRPVIEIDDAALPKAPAAPPVKFLSDYVQVRPTLVADHAPADVYFLPDDPSRSYLRVESTAELEERWRRATGPGLLRETVPSLDQMELDYRDPGWPTAVSPQAIHLQGPRQSGSTEPNPALPRSVISFDYVLAPYLVDSGDLWQASSPLLPELFRLEDLDEISERDVLGDVDQSAGASLAAVGHFTEAETSYLKAFTTLERQRGVDHVLTRSSILGLLRLYDIWNRPERRYYSRLAGPE